MAGTLCLSQAAPLRAEPAARTQGVTLSGGVSLGAYEAGFLHGLLVTAPEQERPRVLTGTSAGSINALVGALQACAPDAASLRRPTDSLLYQVWVPVGLEQLFVPRDATPVSMLSRSAFRPAVEMLRARFAAGLDERCDVRLGFALTRERPRAVPLGGAETTVPRLTEHVLVRLEGRGPGQPPVVSNQTTRELGRHHLLLPLDGPRADPFGALLGAIQASSGFPLAFAPQPVAHCEVDLPRPPLTATCTPEEARAGLFIDGGIFDNRPIALGLSALRDVAEATRPPRLVFIDPELRAWPTPEDASARQPRSNAFSLVAGTLADFVSTARAAELDRLLAHDPEVASTLRLGRVHYPPASEPLGAFFGFVDRELRRFDFYLGLYHARRLRAAELGVAARELPGEGAAADPAWRPLLCLRAVLDGDGDARTACGGEGLRDFRAILRHAIERVADDCLHAPEAATHSAHPICAAMMGGRRATEVPFVDGGEETLRRTRQARWRRAAGEAHGAWTLRRLGELGFAFADLGLSPATAARAPLVLRARLGELVDALAARQGALASHLYRVVGEIGLNLIAYAPARHLFHVFLGNRLELGWSWTEPTSRLRWLRLELGLGFWGIGSLFSDEPNWFGLAPMAGVRLEPLPLSRSLLQPRLSLLGGFVFSSTDGLLAGTCDPVADRTPCSRPVAEAALSVALLSVLRLQLSATVLPPIRAGERPLWSITPGIALQLPYARTAR